ncbi:MAG: hypothetical protein ABI880_14590, partial [Acidobacteriota bacterium]
ATQLRLPEAPMDSRNRRVSIVVRSHSQAHLEESVRTDTVSGATPSPDASAPSGVTAQPVKDAVGVSARAH